MILLRRPIRLFDVDAAALGMLALLAGVAWWGVAVPLQEAGAQSATTRATMSAAEDSRRSARAALNTLVRDSQRLDELLAEFKGTVPTESQRGSVIADIVARATDAGVQVVSVTPLQPIRGERHISIDIDMSLKSTLAALTAFLDRLAAALPYHSIEDITVSEDHSSDGTSCDAKVRLRLFLLLDTPDGPAPAAAAEAGARP